MENDELKEGPLDAPPEAQSLAQDGSTDASPSSRPLHGRTTICKGTPLPAGFVAVNCLIDSSRCNGFIGMTVSNVWVIERFTDRPIGTTLDICDDLTNPIPSGWSVVSRFKSPTQCVLSSGFNAQGAVVRIQRFS